MEKFKIEVEDEEVIFRSIRFPISIFNKINEVKGSATFTKFVIEACKFALDNMDSDNKEN